MSTNALVIVNPVNNQPALQLAECINKLELLIQDEEKELLEIANKGMQDDESNYLEHRNEYKLKEQYIYGLAAALDALGYSR